MVQVLYGLHVGVIYASRRGCYLGRRQPRGRIWDFCAILVLLCVFVTGVLIAPDASSQAYVGGGIGRSNATGLQCCLSAKHPVALKIHPCRSYDARTARTTTRQTRSSAAPAAERCTFRRTRIVPALRDGEPGKGDRSVAGAKVRWRGAGRLDGPLQWSSARRFSRRSPPLATTLPSTSLVLARSAAGRGRREQRRARQPCGPAARDRATRNHANRNHTTRDALADPTRAAANQPRAGRQSVEEPAAKAAAVAIARPQAINAGKEGERAPSRQERGTEPRGPGIVRGETGRTRERQGGQEPFRPRHAQRRSRPWAVRPEDHTEEGMTWPGSSSARSWRAFCLTEGPPSQRSVQNRDGQLKRAPISRSASISPSSWLPMPRSRWMFCPRRVRPQTSSIFATTRA